MLKICIARKEEGNAYKKYIYVRKPDVQENIHMQIFGAVAHKIRYQTIKLWIYCLSFKIEQ